MKNDELKERFERLFTGCKLFAIHLDGFSHEVFYKDKKGIKHIDGYTGCAPEQYTSYHEAYNDCGDMAIISWNEDKTKALFLGYGHSAYQNNAQELIYANHNEW